MEVYLQVPEEAWEAQPEDSAAQQLFSALCSDASSVRRAALHLFVTNLFTKSSLAEAMGRAVCR